MVDEPPNSSPSHYIVDCFNNADEDVLISRQRQHPSTIVRYKLEMTEKPDIYHMD